MNILAFDTSLNKTYIALYIEDCAVSAPVPRHAELVSASGTITAIYESDEKNYHSAYLITGIKKILKENNLTLQEIDLFAVNHGPGSFTGIRAGVTVAKTFAKELNKKVIGINSLDILYKTYQNLDPDIVLDARREQFYIRKENSIELVPYSKISDYITKNTVICDFSGLKHLEEYLKGTDKTLINYEADGKDFSCALIALAKENCDNKDLEWNTLKAAYIQAPPVHKKNS